MVTAPRKGLNASRKVGSAPDNKGLTPYPIESGYATALAVGDPVKLTSGYIVKATNGADAIGVLHSVSYIDSTGTPVWNKYWPASTTGTNIEALVLDDPNASFNALADGPIPLVEIGDIFAMNLTAPQANVGRSTATVAAVTTITGDVDLTAEADLGENVTGVDDNDAFTIKTSQNAGAATTITIEDGDGITELLEKLNAVDNILAALDGDGFLTITATDGYDLVIAESVGTPYADLFAGAAGTFSEVVAANAGLVKVISIPDRTNQVLEVVLVNHSYRDDG
jgi:hypothetical protein